MTYRHNSKTILAVRARRYWLRSCFGLCRYRRSVPPSKENVDAPADSAIHSPQYIATLLAEVGLKPPKTRWVAMSAAVDRIRELGKYIL